MDITIKKSDLEKVLQHVQSAVSSKITLPILSNFLVQAEDGKVKVSGTDMELGITSGTRANIQESGSVAIPAKKFTDMVRELPDKEIQITHKKNQVIQIECEKSHFKLMGLPAEEFPKFPQLNEKNTIITEQGLIKTMLRMTSFSMSNDETRRALNGVLIHINGKTIEMVATDGRRLSCARRLLKESSGFEKSVILPKKAVSELSRSLLDEGDMNITLGENQILFSFGETTLLSRLIDGEFPDYEQVIPKEQQEKVKFNREQFLFAAKRTGLFTSQESQSIKLEFFKDKVILSKSSPEWGEAREEVNVTNEGKEMVIGFNPNYWTDVLKQLPDQEVFLELIDVDKPGVIRSADQYTYMVLPMQIA